MAKKFKAKHLCKLDNPKRKEILPPDVIIEKLDIKKGESIGDVGCGTGYFTIPMAKTVGEKGVIYAIDINEKMLEETENKVIKEGLNNVKIIHSGENDFKIEDLTLDMIFTSTVFHELENPKSFLDECKRVLKKGRLIILDWNKVKEEMGPPLHHRKDVEEVENVLKNNGFSVENVEYIGNSFYMIKSIREK